jgi:hypothetical protein
VKARAKRAQPKATKIRSMPQGLVHRKSLALISESHQQLLYASDFPLL